MKKFFFTLSGVFIAEIAFCKMLGVTPKAFTEPWFALTGLGVTLILLGFAGK